MSGKLYMIPCPIAEGNVSSIPNETNQILHGLTHFIVERARTARRYIKSTAHPIPINELVIFELDKEQPDQTELYDFLKVLSQGKSIGLISEAGCPGIADPGALVVAWAHRHSIQTVPLVGPSSIFLAIMASGMNGQGFTFHGYLPAKTSEMTKALKKLEKLLRSTKQTQIFMEAPYRNMNIVEHALKQLNKDTLLCIACDINTKEEYIVTKSIKDWSKTKIPNLHKRPTIFLIGP